MSSGRPGSPQEQAWRGFDVQEALARIGIWVTSFNLGYN